METANKYNDLWYKTNYVLHKTLHSSTTTATFMDINIQYKNLEDFK